MSVAARDVIRNHQPWDVEAKRFTWSDERRTRRAVWRRATNGGGRQSRWRVAWRAWRWRSRRSLRRRLSFPPGRRMWTP